MEWISHRGSCYQGMENTMAAFLYARSKGFQHFETDLRCTADKQIVLCHDNNLARVSDHPHAQPSIQALNLLT